jgi:hypothetical protein
MEGVGAEVASFEDHARTGDCAIIRAADEGDMDILGRLERMD